jgi:hypothetical protein
MSSTGNQYAMQDPRTQYPQPEFDKQPQPAPGLLRRWIQSQTTAKRPMRDSDASPAARVSSRARTRASGAQRRSPSPARVRTSC